MYSEAHFIQMKKKYSTVHGSMIFQRGHNEEKEQILKSIVSNACPKFMPFTA